MTKKQARKIIVAVNEWAKNLGATVLLLGDGEEFASAIVGVMETCSQRRVVYAYSEVIKCLKRQNKWSDEEALEWYDYNIERSLPYYENHNGPLVINDEIIKDIL